MMVSLAGSARKPWIRLESSPFTSQRSSPSWSHASTCARPRTIAVRTIWQVRMSMARKRVARTSVVGVEPPLFQECREPDLSWREIVKNTADPGVSMKSGTDHGPKAQPQVAMLISKNTGARCRGRMIDVVRIRGLYQPLRIAPWTAARPARPASRGKTGAIDSN